MNEWKQKRFWKEVSVEEDGAVFAGVFTRRPSRATAKPAPSSSTLTSFQNRFCFH